jgi:hypothetical protein
VLGSIKVRLLIQSLLVMTILLYRHETGWTDDGSTRVGDVYAISGPLSLGRVIGLLVLIGLLQMTMKTFRRLKRVIGTKNTPEGRTLTRNTH